MKNSNHSDVIITGHGAVAFSAALYAGRYKMSTLINENVVIGFDKSYLESLLS